MSFVTYTAKSWDSLRVPAQKQPMQPGKWTTSDGRCRIKFMGTFKGAGFTEIQAVKPGDDFSDTPTVCRELAAFYTELADQLDAEL